MHVENVEWRNDRQEVGENVFGHGAVRACERDWCCELMVELVDPLVQELRVAYAVDSVEANLLAGQADKVLPETCPCARERKDGAQGVDVRHGDGEGNVDAEEITESNLHDLAILRAGDTHIWLKLVLFHQFVEWINKVESHKDQADKPVRAGRHAQRPVDVDLPVGEVCVEPFVESRSVRALVEEDGSAYEEEDGQVWQQPVVEPRSREDTPLVLL